MNLKENEETTLIEMKKKTFADWDLFYYVQVICKFINIKPNRQFMDKMINNGAKVNYLNKFNENVLFKVSKVFR